MSQRKNPISKLTRQLKKHHAFSFKNTSQITVFYLKLILQEPFRWWEKLQNKRILRNHTLSKDPIFIIGHWRSGTSFMQYLMACDPQFAYLNKFQAVFPEIFLESENALKALAKRIPQTSNLSDDARDMSLNLKWDSPSEVEIALSTMISPASPHWGHIFPQQGGEYFNKYLFFEGATKEEIARWEKDYAYLIDKISLKNDGRQVLVKSPGNTSRIKKLLELYPKAKFIFLYRNPYDIFYSSQKLWRTLLDNLALQDFSQQQVEGEIVNIYAKLMKNYLRQRSLIPASQLIEIRFEDFVKRPLKKLGELYSQLNIEQFNIAEQKVRSFLSNKTGSKSGAYDYEDRVIAWLNEEWAFAFEQWNYPRLTIGS